MLLQLTDLSDEPLSEQISRQLTDKILAGELQQGTAMQAIRTLARHQRVSIETVRRAYHELAAEGLLEMGSNGAFYVSELSEKERGALAVQHQLGKTLLLNQADSFSRQFIALVHMQKRLLPAAHHADDHVSIAAFSEPTSLVGGDLYDYFTLDRNRYGFIVADACGHGLPAAMLMAQIHAMLKSKVQNGIPLRQIMRETNAYVRTYTLRNKFVSLFFAVYNTDSRQLEYASAGHPFPFLVHKNGKHDFLYFSDAALGLSEDSDYEMHQTAVHPGDILCIYSDGLTEGMDGDHRPFGEERLLTIASAHRNKQPEQILTALRKDFMQFTRNGNHLDDRTILLIKFRK